MRTSFLLSAAMPALVVAGVCTPVIAQSRFVDDAGRSVMLPPQVSRVFAAGAPAELLLYTLVPEKLAGRNRIPASNALDLYPPEYRNPVQIRQLPDRADPAADTELLALKPDIYIDYGSLHRDYVDAIDAIQRRTGVPGIILDGRLERIASTYRRLGAALGVSERGERLAAAAEGIMAKYRGALASGGPSLRVYLACSSDGVVPCLTDEPAAEQIALLGALNVAGTSESAPKGPRTIAEIRALAPDVIVLTAPGAATRLRSHPDWRQVDAVRRGRVYEFPGLPDNWGPRPPSVNRLAGLIWLAHALPQRPFDRTFYDEMQSFFSIFYHVDLTDAQIQRLVARP